MRFSDIDDIDDFIPVNGSLRFFLLKDKIQKYVTAWNTYPSAQMFDEFWRGSKYDSEKAIKSNK